MWSSVLMRGMLRTLTNIYDGGKGWRVETNSQQPVSFTFDNWAEKTKSKLPKLSFLLVYIWNVQLWFLPHTFNFNIYYSSVKFNGNTAARCTWHYIQRQNYQLLIQSSNFWFWLDYFPISFWNIYSDHSVILCY